MLEHNFFFQNSVITQNGKVNNEMCKESHLIQNFNNEAESSKSINDTKPKNLSPIKTKLFDHNVQLDKHDNSRSSISLHSNLSNLQLKEIDSSGKLIIYFYHLKEIIKCINWFFIYTDSFILLTIFKYKILILIVGLSYYFMNINYIEHYYINIF